MTTTVAQHYDAILSTLNATLASARKAYRIGDPAIITDAADSYTEVSLWRRPGGLARLDAVLDSDLMRVKTRYVAKSANNAGVQHSKTRAAIEYASLSIGGSTTTPIQFETEDPIVPDDGWFSGWTDWTYAL